MKRQTNKFAIILAVLMTTLSSLACLPGTQPIQTGPQPAYTIEPSEDALASFNNKWHDLTMATPQGPFTLTFTEAELTSAVHAALGYVEQNPGQPLSIHSVQVLLVEGSIQVYGQADLNPLSVSGRISFVPQVTPQGTIDLEVQDIDFGPLQIDDTALESLLLSVERSINEPLRTASTFATLDAITVSDGVLTISGTIEQ